MMLTALSFTAQEEKVEAGGEKEAENKEEVDSDEENFKKSYDEHIQRQGTSLIYLYFKLLLILYYSSPIK